MFCDICTISPYLFEAAGTAIGIIGGALLSVITFKWQLKGTIRHISKLSSTFSIVMEASRNLQEINKKVTNRNSTELDTELEKEIISEFILTRRLCKLTFKDTQLDGFFSDFYQQGLTQEFTGASGVTSGCPIIIAEIINRLNFLLTEQTSS